jgi:hypothetical protein
MDTFLNKAIDPNSDAISINPRTGEYQKPGFFTTPEPINKNPQIIEELVNKNLLMKKEGKPEIVISNIKVLRDKNLIGSVYADSLIRKIEKETNSDAPPAA